MTIKEAIEFLEGKIPDSKSGLPEEVFLFVSRLTPLVNVDLLIKDERGRTLLAWRDDRHGDAWHVPGGIVRFKEKLEDRIRKVAERELSAEVEFDPAPVAINQFICYHETRGHFISLLYKCLLKGKYVPDNKGLKEGESGFLKWHAGCPKKLIPAHEIYRRHIMSRSGARRYCEAAPARTHLRSNRSGWR